MESVIGKWLLDVAKYIATAVIIKSFFDDITTKWVFYSTGVLVVFSGFYSGVVLYGF